MKVRYHIGTISFCRNLTRPDSAPIPVGILMLAEQVSDPPEHAMALLAVREDRALLESLPPLVRSIVADFPSMLQAQLDEILAADSERSIDDIMRSFEDSLRNSFFVSDLRWNQEIDVPAHRPAREPWQVAYPSVVKTASERLVAAHVTPDAVRQSFTPWIHRPRGHRPAAVRL